MVDSFVSLRTRATISKTDSTAPSLSRCGQCYPHCAAGEVEMNAGTKFEGERGLLGRRYVSNVFPSMKSFRSTPDSDKFAVSGTRSCIPIPAPNEKGKKHLE